MSKENKGREFWVEKEPEFESVHDCYSSEPDWEELDDDNELLWNKGELIHVIEYSAYQTLEQRLADKEQDLRDYKHEWESACERVRNRYDDISELKNELENAIEKVNSCNTRELGHISLIDSQADMIEEFKQRLAEAVAIADRLFEIVNIDAMDASEYHWLSSRQYDLRASLAMGVANDD